MSQLRENPISDEDVHLAEVCQLGHPLAVYQASSHSIRSAYRAALIIPTIGISLSLLLLIIGHMTVWSASLMPDLVGVIVLLAGGAFGLTAGPDARRMHLIVCEMGFVIVSKIFKYNRSVQIVHYRDINKIQRSWFLRDRYCIWSRRGKIFPITEAYYQNADALLALLREQFAASHKQQ